MSPSSSVIQLRTRRIIIKSQSNYPYAPGQLALSLKSVHVALDPELPSCQTVPSPGSPVWKQSAEALETPLKDQQGHMVATSESRAAMLEWYIWDKETQKSWNRKQQKQ